jgi:antitoxin MazE
MKVANGTVVSNPPCRQRLRKVHRNHSEEDFAMKTRIVSIGNSKGIRLPKPLLEQTGLRGEVEIKVEDGSLVIRPSNKLRAGWAAAFRKMAQRGDDAPLDETTSALSSWEESEWEWR